jgi:uncharacterized protein YdeI (YjbR/CyaY-like superfamily)
MRAGGTKLADRPARLKFHTMAPTPTFFASPAEFRQWLEEHHADVQELWVGFHKRSTGKPSLTWPESVDCALSFGWIDGLRKSVDASSYCIRFTPRKPTSTWSAINIRRVAELKKMGLVHPAGLAAFERRKEEKSKIYSYEQRETARLPAEFEKQFRAHQKAWGFFQSQPPWYRRIASFWVVSAKREETRAKRMATLINDSAEGRTIKPLTRPKKAK